MKLTRWLAAGAGIALALTVQADDAYTIRLRELVKGDMVLIERVDVDEVVLVTYDAAGKKVDEKKQKLVTTLVFWEQVLERPAGAPRATKLRRGFGTANLTAEGATQKIGLAGKVILIEKQGDRYRYFVNDKDELKGQEAAFLDKEFNRPGNNHAFNFDMILPGKPVKLNEAWDVDAEAWTASLRAGTGLAFSDDKVRSSGQLTATTLQAGQRRGTLDFRLDAPIKSYRKAGQDLPVNDGARLTLQVTLDVAIDGSDSYGAMKLTGTTSFATALGDGKGQKYTTSVTARNRREQTVKPHKR